MAEHHEMMGGKLHVYRRENSGYWQCSTFLNGKNWRVSTKEDSLAHAKDFAEDWYLGLRGKSHAGVLKVGKTFKQAAEQFVHEFGILTAGERNQKYVDGLAHKIKLHLLPFFEGKVLSEITPGLVQEYRIHRMTSRVDKKTGEPVRPSRSTLHKEIVTLRHVEAVQISGQPLRIPRDRLARVSDAGELAALRDARQSRRLLADAHCHPSAF